MAHVNSWEKPAEPETREHATHSPILNPEEARGGVISGRVRMVLAVSLMLAVAAFAVVFVVGV
jgi:hypothetical protein